MVESGHEHLQADAFCEYCSYNLRGQPVHRDPVLGLMVCRCPECGRYHPAGQGRGLMSYRARLGADLLAAGWGLFMLIIVGLSGIGMGVAQLLHVHAMSYPRQVAPDGREVVYAELSPGTHQLVYAGTTQPMANLPLRAVRALTPPANFPPEYRPPWWAPLFILFFAAIVSVPPGILMVNLLWYWPRRALLWMLLIPFLAAGFLAGVIWFDEDYYRAIRAWGIQRVVVWAFIEAGLMYIGLVIGRPIGRLLLRMFVPPQPRQHLAFLWRVDGKTPVVAAETAAATEISPAAARLR